jgi:hypothetical protein
MRILIGILILLLSHQVKAQDKAAFYANSSSLEVMEGSNFRVEFIMNNMRGSNFKPPVFDNFLVLSGPSQTSSYSNTNGKVNQQYIYSYQLQAQKEGKYTIRSAYCDFNGQKLATTPFTITVVKRDEKTLAALGLPSDKDMFVRLETVRDTAYMGEKVVLDYVLYTRKEVRSFDLKSESEYSGFFVRQYGSQKESPKQTIIDGITYSSQILVRRLLYPQQTGTFEIEGASMTLGLPDPNRRSSSFFLNSSLKQFPVQTNSVTLHVVGLPEGAPESFSGAVGKFQMQADIDKSKLSTDDALTLTITVAGNGDSKYILPPAQTHLEDFEIYDPSTIEKGERQMYGELQTVKQFEYLVVPRKAGRQNIQAKFTYFDTSLRKYVTLESQVFPLMVEQGNTISTTSIDQGNDSDRNLTGLMTGLKLRSKGKSFFGGPVHFSLMGIILLGIGFIFYKKRQIDIEAGIDPLIKKRLKAQKVAEERLALASQFMEQKDHRAFYEEISRSLLGFIADKLHVPNSEISKSNVESRLTNEGVQKEKVAEIMSILSKAELAVFAGKKDGDLHLIYEQTKEHIAYLNGVI